MHAARTLQATPKSPPGLDLRAASRAFIFPRSWQSGIAPCCICIPLIQEISVPLGKFVVSPATHQTESGTFRASVTVSSGHGMATRHRVYRFDTLFATPEAARMYALTQGTLQVQPA